MSSQQVLLRGENLRLVRTLYAADGTTLLPVESIASAKVELFIENKLFGEYIYGTSPELRASGTDALELEITTAMSLAMGPGRLREKWTITTNDASFVVDGGKRVDLIELSDVLLR